MSARLVTIDTTTMVRLGYAAAVSVCLDICLLGQATSPDEAMEMIHTLEPNVVTVDTHLSGWDGLQLAIALRLEQPWLGIVLTGPVEDEYIFDAADAGLSAFLPRTSAVELLIAAIRHAAVAPTSFNTPNLATALTRRLRATTLSLREQQILRHLADGSTLSSIAGQLQLSESTVRTYVSRLYDKLGVRTRAQAIIVATQYHLL